MHSCFFKSKFFAGAPISISYIVVLVPYKANNYSLKAQSKWVCAVVVHTTGLHSRSDWVRFHVVCLLGTGRVCQALELQLVTTKGLSVNTQATNSLIRDETLVLWKGHCNKIWKLTVGGINCFQWIFKIHWETVETRRQPVLLTILDDKKEGGSSSLPESKINTFNVERHYPTKWDCLTFPL